MISLYSLSKFIFINSFPKIKYGKENVNLSQPIKIGDVAIYCRDGLKYANVLCNNQSRFCVSAKKAVALESCIMTRVPSNC